MTCIEIAQSLTDKQIINVLLQEFSREEINPMSVQQRLDLAIDIISDIPSDREGAAYLKRITGAG